MTKSVFALTLGLALTATACGGSDTSAPAGDMAGAVAPAVSAGDGGDLAAYPELYRTLGLPALPGATVTSTGRQTTSLRDGLDVRLTTAMSVAEVRDFYRQALTAGGWTEQVGPGQAAQAMMPNLPLARLTFVKASMSYSATITANDGTTQVVLNVLEP